MRIGLTLLLTACAVGTFLPAGAQTNNSTEWKDEVMVNYRGTLIDGTEFDSSAKRGGKPVPFTASRGLRGWTEALQLMKPGAKWQIFLPAVLAYGDKGAMPNIEPGSTLIFDV